MPHPDREMAQNLITPDVVVFRGGTVPSVVVFDAKYVGRKWVEFHAAKTHARYSRIRSRGKPVVRSVLVAHPHQGIDFIWAGYGSVPMTPRPANCAERSTALTPRPASTSRWGPMR